MNPSYDSPPQPQSSWARDAARLMAAWQIKNCLDFSIFRSLWVEWNFGAIHFSEVPQIQPQFRLQTMYSCFLVYLTRRLPLLIHVGAFYAIYLLHQTQQFSPRVPIRISLSLLRQIQELCQAASRILGNPILDILAIYNRLIDTDAFMITAHLPIPELAEEATFSEPDEDATGFPAYSVAPIISIPELQHLGSQYAETKAKLFSDSDPNYAQLNIVDSNFAQGLSKLLHSEDVVDHEPSV